MASNIQNTGVSTSTSSTGGTRSNVVRVFDIVLDANHPIFDNIQYDPTLVGMVFYGDKDLDITTVNSLSLPKALPKFGPQKIPLKYECVKIETGPSPDIYTDIGGNNAFNYVYYGEVVPVHGNAVHNALPSQKNLASTTPTSEESVLASNGTPNQSQPNEVSLDNTGNYQAKDNVRNLQPYAGDVITEGRAGQTIRMGTTNKEGANNWSDGDTFGDPVMIMRVGQSENQQGSTVVEDVNGDASSIYMFANQKLNNIQLTTTNFESCQATYTEATVPTVQLTISPLESLPPKPIPIAPQEPFLLTGSIIKETSPPPVTSSFSDDELVDPVFAALAEVEEEGLLIIETTPGWESNEPDTNTPISDVPTNNLNEKDAARVLNPNRIGYQIATKTPLYSKYKFDVGFGRDDATEEDSKLSKMQPFIDNGTIVEVGDANTNSNKFSRWMDTAIIFKGKYYLHKTAAPPFFNWLNELDYNNINYHITSALRFGKNTGAGPHGYGLAVDFGNLHQIVDGSTNLITNKQARINSTEYREIAEIGKKYGWYNPWRLSDSGGDIDEIWHFEYWGEV